MTHCVGTTMKKLLSFLLVMLIAPTLVGGQVVNYYPPPNTQYNFSTGAVALGSATGGLETAGSLNAQQVYVNGVPVSTTVPCTLANPTATIGLTAVNGVAVTCFRSDAAQALSQAIVPTWTGLHTFNGGSNTTLSEAIGDATHYGTETVGLGTFNANPTPGDPPHILDVINSDGTMQGLRISSYGTGAVASTLHFVHMRGTITAPAALSLGDNFLSIGGRGYDVAPTGSAIAIEGVTTENWTTANNNGSELQFQVTPIGSSSASRRNALRINGNNAIFQNVVGNPAINTGVTIGGRSNLPAVYIVNNGNAADQKLVEMIQGSGFAIGFNNDANSSSESIIGATRGTANAVATVTLGNNTDIPAVTVNGDLQAGGGAPTMSGCGTPTSIAGGQNAGKMNANSTTCAVTFTFAKAATTGYACSGSNLSAQAAAAQTNFATNQCTLVYPSAAVGNVLSFQATGF